jgi:hypothetical protein
VSSVLASLRRAQERYARGDLVPTRDERRGFVGGARWMARAMGREIDAARAVRASRACALKYAVALGIAACAALLTGALFSTIAALPVFVLVFYGVEVQGVFVVPLVVLGEARPFKRSRALIARSGGTAGAVTRVLPIAAWMLFAGPLRGFTGAWCEGCLAVLDWFEDARRA